MYSSIQHQLSSREFRCSSFTCNHNNNNNNNNTEPCTHQFSINFHLENLNAHHSHATISFHLENLDPRPRCGGLFGYVRGVCLFDPVIPQGVCDVPHRIGENVPDAIYVETLFNQVDAF